MSPASTALVISVARHVNHHRAGKDENTILSTSDLHSVRVRPEKPLFGHARHGPSITGKRVFMIEEVPFRFQVVSAGYIHGERAVDEREERFLHDGGELRFSINVVGRPPRQERLANAG